MASAKLSSVSDLRSAFAGRGLGGTAHENDEVRLRGASGAEKVIYGRGGGGKGGRGNGAGGAAQAPVHMGAAWEPGCQGIVTPDPGPDESPWQCASPVPGSLGLAASATLSPSSGSGSGSRQGRCVSCADITVVSDSISTHRDSDSTLPGPGQQAEADHQ